MVATYWAVLYIHTLPFATLVYCQLHISNCILHFAYCQPSEARANQAIAIS